MSRTYEADISTAWRFTPYDGDDGPEMIVVIDYVIRIFLIDGKICGSRLWIATKRIPREDSIL